MAQKRIDTEMVTNFVNSVFDINPEKKLSGKMANKIEQVTNLVEDGKGNGKGTIWDMYNAVTEYADHYMSSSSERRAKSALFGKGFDVKSRALDLAVKLASA